MVSKKKKVVYVFIWAHVRWAEPQALITKAEKMKT